MITNHMIEALARGGNLMSKMAKKAFEKLYELAREFGEGFGNGYFVHCTMIPVEMKT